MKHNLSRTRIYRCYQTMKARCYNKHNCKYYSHGKRGIIVCNEWLDSENGFMNFYNWAMHNGYNDNLTLDRINNNGNYEPSNCRWANSYVQANNKRNNFLITFNGITKTIHQWAKLYNIGVGTLRYRIINGWDIEKALKTKAIIGRNQYRKEV